MAQIMIMVAIVIVALVVLMAQIMIMVVIVIVALVVLMALTVTVVLSDNGFDGVTALVSKLAAKWGR